MQAFEIRLASGVLRTESARSPQFAAEIAIGPASLEPPAGDPARMADCHVKIDGAAGAETPFWRVA